MSGAPRTSGSRVVVGFVLVFVPFFNSTLQSPGTLMASFQTGLWSTPSNETFLRYNFSGTTPEGYSNLSLCYRIRFALLRNTYVSHFSIASSDHQDNTFNFGYIRERYHLFVNNIYETRIVEEKESLIYLGRWMHYCHVLSNELITIYENGEVLAESNLTKSTPVLLNGSLILGQEQDGLSSGFQKYQSLCGSITQFNIWDFCLGEEDVRALASCSKDLRGNLFFLGKEGTEVFNVSMETVPVDQLCRENKSIIVIPTDGTASESEEFCRRLGHIMYMPMSSEENANLHSVSKPLSNRCGGQSSTSLWLAGTDAGTDGQWRHSITGRPLSYFNFQDGEPNGGDVENCVALHRETGEWQDYRCGLESRKCAVCEWDGRSQLYLRGLCEPAVINTKYSVQGYINGEPFFRGYFGRLIHITPAGSWVVFDKSLNLTLLTLPRQIRSEYPLGRRSWRVNSSLCEINPGALLQLSLSSCSSHEYMCHSGDCIPKALRCDSREDCKDHSDEYNCSVVTTTSAYRRDHPPTSRRTNQPLPVDLRVTLLHITKIDDVNEFMGLEYNTSFSWVDHRLQFRNLRACFENNILSQKGQSMIWAPKPDFLNIYDGTLKKMKSRTFIYRTGPPLESDVNAVSMDEVYEGVSGLIQQHHLFSGRFSCSFDIFFYPFDRQSCFLDIALYGNSRDLVVLRNVSVDLGRKLGQLATFSVDAVEVERKMDPDPRTASIKVTVSRRYLLLVINMFLPSFLLVCIGYSTLYVKISLLQVRLPVSLTTLLVLYTLYSQTSTAVSKTSYVKMADIWFFFCILLLFLIILFHVFVDWLEGDNRPSKGCLKVQPVTAFPGKGGSEAIWTAVKQQQAYRIFKVLVPLVFLVFMVYFWVSILSQ